MPEGGGLWWPVKCWNSFDGRELHRECGRLMAASRVDFLLGVRGLAKAMVGAACERDEAEFVATPEEAGSGWRARR